jgi:DNA-binding CsgD family transcriptional regulator
MYVSPTDMMASGARLGEAVVDPAAWLCVIEDICRAVGAAGAIMVQSDVRPANVLYTASLNGLAQAYLRDGWHLNDPRVARYLPRLIRGERVITDLDLFTSEEVRREPYYTEFLIPNGFRWLGVVAFRAGSALWRLSLQRTPNEGIFAPESKPVLAQLSRRLSDAATLSEAVSRAALTGCINALDLVHLPALAIDRLGKVLGTNVAADATFDCELRVYNRQLWISDKSASAEFERFVDGMRISSETGPVPTNPIVVRRREKPPLLIRILPVEPAARSPFLGARVLLLLTDPGEKGSVAPDLLVRTFSLTPAEAKLAVLIGAGEALERAAGKLSISPLTARTQLKAVFAKTDTHRQSELVALLSRLHSLRPG